MQYLLYQYLVVKVHIIPIIIIIAKRDKIVYNYMKLKKGINHGKSSKSYRNTLTI